MMFSEKRSASIPDLQECVSHRQPSELLTKLKGFVISLLFLSTLEELDNSMPLTGLLNAFLPCFSFFFFSDFFNFCVWTYVLSACMSTHQKRALNPTGQQL